MNKSCSFNFTKASLLFDKSPDLLKQKYGIQIIHQSWKSCNIPKNRVNDVKSWFVYHPEALHVLWTDEDNINFVKEFYPQYLDTYESLKIVIQKCDLVRLLYLHRYGGVYADLDYEAHQNIFTKLPTQPDGSIYDVMLVESPFLIHEVVQNSLMIASTLRHPFWIAVVENIVEIVKFVNPLNCSSKDTKSGWEQCKIIRTMDNPLTKKVMNVILTPNITGPAVIDKTLVKSSSENWSVKTLPKKEFFKTNILEDRVSTHHHGNSWVSIPKMFPEIITLIVFLVLIIIALTGTIVFFVSNNNCNKRFKSNCRY